MAMVRAKVLILNPLAPGYVALSVPQFWTDTLEDTALPVLVSY